MKKIAILTINDNTNYGNRLQNYAVQTILENMGVHVETIINNTHYGDSIITKLKKYNYNPKVVFDKIGKKIKNKKYNTEIQSKITRCKEFNKQYMKISDYTITKDNIPDELNDKYDYFIIGSDQVWNLMQIEYLA